MLRSPASWRRSALSGRVQRNVQNVQSRNRTTVEWLLHVRVMGCRASVDPNHQASLQTARREGSGFFGFSPGASPVPVQFQSSSSGCLRSPARINIPRFAISPLVFSTSRSYHHPSNHSHPLLFKTTLPSCIPSRISLSPFQAFVLALQSVPGAAL